MPEACSKPCSRSTFGTSKLAGGRSSKSISWALTGGTGRCVEAARSGEHREVTLAGLGVGEADEDEDEEHVVEDAMERIACLTLPGSRAFNIRNLTLQLLVHDMNL